MVSRRQSPLSSGCENLAIGEFDALLATGYESSNALRAEEVLEWIEDSDTDVRFVPDFADETIRNAA